MKYLLDTNICIHLFHGKQNLVDKFQEINIHDCAISEITLAELAFGAENSSSPEKNFNIVDSFSEEVRILPIYSAIHSYAKEKVRLRKLGIMISDFDLLIGCTATSNDLIMVTENVKEFIRIHEIRLQNWMERE